MSFGGYHPFPKRRGGGKPRLKVFHEALNAARGSAIDASDPTSVAWVENMAYARALVFDGVGTNEKLGNQRDPDRMTDMLPRWEAIFGLRPAPTATQRERRDAVKARFQRFINASAIHSRILAILKRELGAFFSAIEYIDITNAVVRVPDATYPWGTVSSGAPWMSTVAHILVLMVKPAGATEGDFYNAAAKVAPALDGVVPAWVKFSWYRAPLAGPSINVSGGPSQAGFYLDAEANLDNNVFDV